MLDPVVSATPVRTIPAMPAPHETRCPGTMADGTPFPESLVEAIWEKASPIPGFDPTLWRLDARNEAICRFDYRCDGVRFAWEIDHVLPVALGGTDAPENLQPLRVTTNRRKGDAWPWHGP